jgi:hypothetical protein
MRKLSFIIVIIPLLFGCGSMLQARVAAFHTLSPDHSGVTFVVVPFDWQKGSLEFQTKPMNNVSSLN